MMPAAAAPVVLSIGLGHLQSTRPTLSLLALVVLEASMVKIPPSLEIWLVEVKLAHCPVPPMLMAAALVVPIQSRQVRFQVHHLRAVKEIKALVPMEVVVVVPAKLAQTIVMGVVLEVQVFSMGMFSLDLVIAAGLLQVVPEAEILLHHYLVRAVAVWVDSGPSKVSETQRQILVVVVVATMIARAELPITTI